MTQQTVLYRKYRPLDFDQVVGQDHIVKVLKGSLELGKIGHAYLFSGPRGTGKTTTARIFAKELGCSANDIIEIDAASNRGIDDIRSLRDAVHSLPFESEKKMYIIDEVHMLTKEAFNALLKTLEEPPAHVVFILATTELHKVLPTIISRCQSFVFKSPQRKTLMEMIKGIVEKEGYDIDQASLELIALLGNGSFRDTQGVLQKIMSYSKDMMISRDEVELVTGAPSMSIIIELIEALNARDMEKALASVHRAEEQNIDPHIFLQMLVEELRHILLLRFAPESRKDLKEGMDEGNFMRLLAIAKEKNNIHADLLLELLSVYDQMHYAFGKYLPLELFVMAQGEKK